MNKKQTNGMASNHLMWVRNAVNTAFVLPWVLIPLGFVVQHFNSTLADAIHIFTCLDVAGLVFVYFAVLPYLRCPKCRKRFFFFEATGCLRWLCVHRPMFESACMNCKMELVSRRELHPAVKAVAVWSGRAIVAVWIATLFVLPLLGLLMLLILALALLFTGNKPINLGMF